MSSKIKNILKEYAKGLSKIIGNNLKQIILYGSYAREEQEENGEVSDIDILILVDLNDDEIKILEKKIIEYSYGMDLKYNVLFSPIIENEIRYKDIINYMRFYKNIEREGVLLNG